MSATLMRLADRTQEDGACLIWKGGCCNGHPATRHNGKTVLVRRLLWQELHGEIPAGHIVRMTCECKKCIEPAHMKCTTYQRLAKQLGALGVMSGPVRSAAIQKAKRNSKQCKLTLDAVRAIRASDETTIVLAARYGVAQAHISKVRKHKCQIDYQSPFTGLGARG